jgi:hypothetical protein
MSQVAPSAAAVAHVLNATATQQFIVSVPQIGENQSMACLCELQRGAMIIMCSQYLVIPMLGKCDSHEVRRRWRLHQEPGWPPQTAPLMATNPPKLTGRRNQIFSALISYYGIFTPFHPAFSGFEVHFHCFCPLRRLQADLFQCAHAREVVGSHCQHEQPAPAKSLLNAFALLLGDCVALAGRQGVRHCRFAVAGILRHMG